MNARVGSHARMDGTARQTRRHEVDAWATPWDPSSHRSARFDGMVPARSPPLERFSDDGGRRQEAPTPRLHGANGAMLGILLLLARRKVQRNKSSCITWVVRTSLPVASSIQCQSLPPICGALFPISPMTTLCRAHCGRVGCAGDALSRCLAGYHSPQEQKTARDEAPWGH